MDTDVFISYSRVDQPFIVALDRFLTNLGVLSWLDKKSLLPGKKWEDEIEDQIHNTSIFLTCMSQAGLDKKGYFHVEQSKAAQAALRMPPEKLYIMPITLGECSIPRLFRQYNVTNLAEPGAISLLLQSLAEALDKPLKENPSDIVTLQRLLHEHIGVEAESNKDFESRFLAEEVSFETSASLIQRIANSSDFQKLKLLLKFRALPQISYAEQRALDIAIDNVKAGRITEDLQANAVRDERSKISQMGIGSNPELTRLVQINKYVRFTSRNTTEAYAMAEKKILELIKKGIISEPDYSIQTIGIKPVPR